MTRLRAPGGCPWDRAQSHASLLKYLKEESKEVAQAVRKNNMENLKEELGDVLLQVIFHAEMARQNGDFDIYDVVTELRNKLVRRHPHVFKKGKNGKNLTAGDVLKRWKTMKAREKKK